VFLYIFSQILEEHTREVLLKESLIVAFKIKFEPFLFLTLSHQIQNGHLYLSKLKWLYIQPSLLTVQLSVKLDRLTFSLTQMGLILSCKLRGGKPMISGTFFAGRIGKPITECGYF
jgi:hypothetical protein